MSSKREQLQRPLWAVGFVIAGCSVYDASLLNGGRNTEAIAGGGSGAAGRSGQGDDGGANAAGEAGAPVEPSAGAPVGSGAGQGGSNAAGQSNGGASVGGSAAGSEAKGGSPSSGGSAGNGAAAGSSPSGGASGSAGSGGAAHTGCALLSVTFDASTDYSHHVITLDADTNLSNATLSALVYAPNAAGGSVYLYVQQANYTYYAQPLQALSGLKNWASVSWDLSQVSPSGFDKTKVRRIGIGIDAGTSNVWTDPTLVYVDSVTVTTPTLSFPFDTVNSVNTTPTTYHVGDNAIWLNNGPDDTTATGAKISWSAKCN